MIMLTHSFICSHTRVILETGPKIKGNRVTSRKGAPGATSVCHLAATTGENSSFLRFPRSVKCCLHHLAWNQIKAQRRSSWRHACIYSEAPLKLEIMNRRDSYQGCSLIVLLLEVWLPTLQETCLQFTRGEWLIASHQRLRCLENRVG